MPPTTAAAIAHLQADTDAASPTTRRFTLDGDQRIEAHIARHCMAAVCGVQRIVAAPHLQALWLGGGYGRGEGGVLNSPCGDEPYNDLEFYLCLRGNRFLNRRRYVRALDELATAMRPCSSLEIEFQIVSLAQLQQRPPSMFYYDLVAGHHRLLGDATLLESCAHQHDPRVLPLAEATRLLMNRGSGLLFARERLEPARLDAEDLDFVQRNIAKAQLALGDAVLTAFGAYHWSCLERHQRLISLPEVRALPWFSQLRHHHLAGVEFKLHPRQNQPGVESLHADFQKVSEFMQRVWLWLESRRLRKRFDSVGEYVADCSNKWPESPAWRNWLLNVSIHGPLALCLAHPHRHPRERVLHALTRLLWEEEEFKPPAIWPGKHSSPSNRLNAYRKMWERIR